MKTFYILTAFAFANLLSATDYYLVNVGGTTQPKAGVIKISAAGNVYWELEDEEKVRTKATQVPGINDNVFYTGQTLSASSQFLLMNDNTGTTEDPKRKDKGALPIDASGRYIAQYNNFTVDYTSSGSAVWEICSSSDTFSGEITGSLFKITGTFENKSAGKINIRRATNTPLDVEINKFLVSKSGAITNFGSSNTNTVRDLNITDFTVKLTDTATSASSSIFSSEVSSSITNLTVEHSFTLAANNTIKVTNTKTQGTGGSITLTLNTTTGSTKTNYELGAFTLAKSVDFIIGDGVKKVEMTSFTQDGMYFTPKASVDSCVITNKGNHTINYGDARMVMAHLKTGYTIEGDFIISSAKQVTFRGVSADFKIKGAIVNNGVILSDDYYSGNNLGDYSITAGGISGGNGTHGIRISTTDAAQSKTVENGNFTINLNGTNKNIYTSRIHDMSYSSTQTEADEILGGKINLNITGGEGFEQYLTGQIYLRGSITVNSGTLHLRADGNNTTNRLGVSNIVLNGGVFSAVGAGDTIETVNKIGLVITKDMTWSAGIIEVDISGATSDLIEVLGTLNNGNTGIKHTFNFNAISALSENEYKILTFEGTDFSESDFEGYLSGYDVSFTLDYTNGELWAKFAQIPEPSFYATIFGISALLWAVRKRKRH